MSDPPSSSATAAALSASRSATTTHAPSATSRCAMALPIPLPAPVTRATRVARGFGFGIRRSLASSSGQVPDAELLRLLDRRVRRHGLRAPHHVDGVVLNSPATLSLFAEQRVRGVLLTPTDATGRNIAAFRRHGIPFVLVDRVAEGTTECSVSVDDVAGGALAVRHLVDAGHRPIAYVSGPPGPNQVRDRRTGALNALAEAGLGPDALRELPTERLDVAAGRDAGARPLGLADRPTAVFCANDLLALGVLQAVYAAGVNVPDDLAIVGHDDIEFAAAAAVPLTSVRQPAVTMGALAAELLLEETEAQGATAHEHRRVVLQPELVVRSSSLPAR
ncbi:substrate-binding domain-containing protein [Streptomyces sp. NPDC020801]|uniref:substrate-binding domain-containing protein n=1 Tax=unclassified Streptomyces TaxID=2593676 RepID=UPI00378C9D3A